MSDDKEALRQKVVKQIEEAFADTPYPGDDNIGWGCGTEGAEFDKVFRGKHWRELNLEFVMYHQDELPCITAGGFRFYLPAFMLAVLNHFSEVDTLSGNLIFTLSPPDNEPGTLNGTFQVHAAQFNRVEQEAILAFLGSFLLLQPEEFSYGEWGSPYKPLLAAAITFWKTKRDTTVD